MRLEVRELRYGYTPEREVVKGVSFAVQAGECMAVLGTNGVGKTTMLKCINRILRPTAGEVLVDGLPVRRLSGRELAQRIGYVPQGCEFADSSVFDAVLLGRKPFLQWDVTKGDLEIVQEVLKRRGREGDAHRDVNALSGWPSKRRCCCSTSPPAAWTCATNWRCWILQSRWCASRPWRRWLSSTI